MASKRFETCAGASLAFTMFLQTTVLAQGLLDQAELFYRQGNYVKASECLQAQLRQNGYDARAHYMLGNVYYGSGRFTESAREYRTALTMSPEGTIAQYCQAALAKLGQGTFAPPPSTATTNTSALSASKGSAATKSASSASDDLTKTANHSKHPPATETPEQADLREAQGSAQKISNQTKATEDRYTEECEAHIRDINKDLDAQIKRLSLARFEDLNATGDASVRGTYTYKNTPENERIRADYDARIEAAKTAAGQKIAGLKEALKTRQMAAEDTAIAIDRGYVNKNKQSNVKLRAAGTDIFVRNYESADDPSGNSVPIALPPAKGLPQSKPLTTTKAAPQVKAAKAPLPEEAITSSAEIP